MVEYRRARSALLLAAGATALISASQAFAQAAPATSAEDSSSVASDEIVVTARSQGESLMSVPVAVSALSAADMARYATSDLIKVAQMRPQVEIYSGGSRSGAAFLIRGIGTTADVSGVEPSVSVSVDGMQAIRGRIVTAGLFDVQQLEILSGPQALFFGKNASAGVIAVKSSDPTRELGGYMTGGYEFEARERYVEGAINVPVTETLRLRFAGRYSKMRGWVENFAVAYPDPSNPSVILPAPFHRWGPGSETLGGRITAVWEPSPNYTSKVKVALGSYKDNGPTSTTELICSTRNPITLGLPALNNDCSLNGKVAINDLPSTYTTSPFGDARWNGGVPFTDSNSLLATWQQSLDLGPVTINATTGYSTLKFVSRGNFNMSERAEFSGGSDTHYRSFSQELRAITKLDGPLNFTVGGYYERVKDRNESALYLANLGPDSVYNTYMSGFNSALERSRTISVFGQVRYNILENLELAGGARYSKVKKKVVEGQPFTHEIFCAIGALRCSNDLLKLSRSEDNVSPEVTLTWHPQDDSTLYAAYKTGYKTGGIAQPALLVPKDTAESVVFRPEKSKGGEIGYKGVLMDRRLRLSATAYYYKFSGLQLTSFDPVNTSYRIQNAANAKQRGIELEVNFKATDELSLRSSANYNKVTYGTFLNASCWSFQTEAQGCVDGVQDLSGKRLHRAPLWSASVGFSYDVPVGGDLKIGITSDLRYRSGALSTETRSPLSQQDKYILLNAGVRLYQDAQQGWELALIGRNLTNQRVISFANDNSGSITNNEVQAWTIRPREVAVQAKLNF